MICQKDKFNLSDEITFVNGAYMSPLLKSSEEAGIRGIRKKRMPADLTINDFFGEVDELRRLHAELIGSNDPSRSVVIPSASYGLANIANNLPDNGRRKIVLLGEQFPSNYYIWTRLAKEKGLDVVIVNKPEDNLTWSESIIDNIDEETLAVAMAPIQWGDGSLFDIEAISDRCKARGSLFVLDGTQFIGAHPYDHKRVKPDALITASYKWMLGPYGIGMGYIGEAFDHGKPFEESWLNKVNSDDFQYLTDYQNEYREGARRYEMGEAPDFIKIPMLKDSIRQLIEWTPAAIQEYCRTLIGPMLTRLEGIGYKVPPTNHMAAHLFGIGLPAGVDMDTIKREVAAAKISISYRGESIRVSPNIYNTEADIELLTNVLSKLT